MANNSCSDSITFCITNMSFGLGGVILLSLTVSSKQIYQIYQHIKITKQCRSLKLWILYIQSLLCILLSGYFFIEYSVLTVFNIAVEFLIIELDTLIFYYFAKETLELGEAQSNKCVKCFLIIFNCIYTTVFFIVITFEVLGNFSIEDCSDPIWAFFDISDLVLCVCMLSIGLRVSKRLRQLSTTHGYYIDYHKKKELWVNCKEILIGGMAFSSVVGVCEDFYFLIRKEEDCLNYSSDERLNIVIFILDVFLKYFLQILVILYIFWDRSQIRKQNYNQSNIMSTLDDIFLK